MATIAKHNVAIGAKLDKLQQDLKKAQGPLSKLQTFATGIGGALGGAFAVKRIADFTTEAVKLAGQADGIQRAFNKLDDPTLLNDLQRATDGTIARMDLMKAAVRAKNFKIPLDQLATFFEFATKRATATGESVNYLTESIINGIGRKSTLVMDNLGISAAELQEEIKKVGDFGQAAWNIISRELAKTGEVTDNAAAKTERLAASWKNFKITMGQILSGPGNSFLDFLNGIVTGLDAMAKGLSILPNFTSKMKVLIGLGSGTAGAAATLSTLGQLATVYDDVQLSAEGAEGAITDVVDGLDDTVKKVERLASIDMAAIFGIRKPGAKVKGIRGTNVDRGTTTGTGGIAAGLNAETFKEITPAVFDLNEELRLLQEQMFDWEEKVGEPLQAVGGYFSDFFEGFAGGFTKGENALQQFGDYFKKWALGIIAQLAAVAAAAAVLSLITGGSFKGAFSGLFGGGGFGGMLSGFKTLNQSSGEASLFLKGEDMYTAYNRYSRNKG